MKLIVGLGNPGKKYEHTRHNVGFLVLNEMIQRLRKKPEWKKKRSFRFCSFNIDKEDVILAEPRVFMNESGIPVKELVDELHIDTSDLMIIVDDIALPLGKIRYRTKGSAGGHNGLKSIIDWLDTDQFPRLRIGISSPEKGESDLADYVLSTFHTDEKTLLKDVLGLAADACMDWLKLPSEALMAKYN